MIVNGHKQQPQVANSNQRLSQASFYQNKSLGQSETDLIALQQARHNPNSFSGDEISILQRSIGNQAVIKLLRSIPPKSSPRSIAEVNQGYSIQRQGHHAPAGNSVNVPPPEFLASSNQTESTADYYTVRIVQIMRQHNVGFVEAARLVAKRNLTGHGEQAGRSGHLSTLKTADIFVEIVRQALAIQVSNVPGRDRDLPITAAHLSERGLATQALRRDYGANNVSVVRNPTAAVIQQRISAGITKL